MFYNTFGDGMKQVLLQLKCPHCFHVNLKVAETIVNPNIESNLKKQILNDEFFSIKCRCGTEINFLYPCVYVDKKQHLILFMKETSILHDDNCIQRLVHNAEEFKEEIRINDAKLDDRVIAKIKRQIQVKSNKAHIYFIDRDADYLWFECDGQISGVERSVYNKIASGLEKPNQTIIDVKQL